MEFCPIIRNLHLKHKCFTECKLLYATGVYDSLRESMARLRTKKGNVTTEARKKHGMKSGKGKKKNSFPIFDKTSAESALHLRGHTKTKAVRKSIINRARQYAPTAASNAYASDKEAGKI